MGLYIFVLLFSNSRAEEAILTGSPQGVANAPKRIVDAECSSVSIVSDYRLDDRGSIPDRGRGFFF
jgi:hypothetical protein